MDTDINMLVIGELKFKDTASCDERDELIDSLEHTLNRLFEYDEIFESYRFFGVYSFTDFDEDDVREILELERVKNLIKHFEMRVYSIVDMVAKLTCDDGEVIYENEYGDEDWEDDEDEE